MLAPGTVASWRDPPSTVPAGSASRTRWLDALLALAVAACSSDPGAAGKAAPPTTCADVCAACPASGVADCLNECFAEAVPCPSETSAVLACVVTADASACGAGSDFPTCESQRFALAGCMACVPEPYGPPCIACWKQSCCGAWRATRADPHFFDFEVCNGPCGYACSDACVQQYPQQMAEMNALNACAAANCQGVCP